MASMHRNQAKFPLLLPLDLMEAVQKEAQHSDRSVSAVIRVALRHYFATTSK
ncbi:CopG family transcriptional regulator [Chroococcidiopsis sp. FACHB-1243]|uniref:ribbon-helix-helix domain-containing protein n=1 Tax=Chroococcidiopsis sp. [FACHB-1243] TaxID=2692781 RepID=UPI00177C3070|nr:ribbon-helix-helix domain-containing protein [Chroococcidiopsis sp. [FACHB-1243]]MBD2308585.1 CopG family transcriptional regulator [Chroococcidiopsis sp. [FACHB-1243]]